MIQLLQPLLFTLHRAAIEAGLAGDRSALFVGINPHFVAGLKTADTPAAQLLIDLQALNSTGRLTDGTIPLLVWLCNAAALAHSRPQVEVFRDTVTLLRRKIADSRMEVSPSEPLDPSDLSAIPESANDSVAPRVLIINDMPNTMRYTINWLRGRGVIVKVATSSQDALHQLELRSFDAIVSDIRRGRVPDEGIRFLQRIRSLGYTQPLVFSVADLDRSKGVPPGASAICNNHEDIVACTLRLLHAFYVDKNAAPSIELCNVLSPQLVAHLKTSPQTVFSLPQPVYKELIAELLAKYGWHVDLMVRTRDDAHDIFAVHYDAAGIRTTCLVECRHVRPGEAVQISAVHALFGVKDMLRAGHAILATTGRFRSDVEQYAASRWDLQLRDYTHVVDWINHYNPLPDGKLYYKENKIILPGDGR